jgi:hypothetical protein
MLINFAQLIDGFLALGSRVTPDKNSVGVLQILDGSTLSKKLWIRQDLQKNLFGEI